MGQGLASSTYIQALSTMTSNFSVLPPPTGSSSWMAQTYGPPRSAYVHIPFCRRRCFYCDFPISVIGDRHSGDQAPAITRYVNHLCREIRGTPSLGQSLDTVFLGGGTPSLLSPGQLQQILQSLQEQFGLNPGAEVSIEMDPGTFDRAKLQGFLAAGITRISFGAQAFQDELLAACGRSHSVGDIYAAYELLQEEGASNVSFDLISGLPYQRLEQWQASLEKAIALKPQHLSVYDLIVEPKTVFARRYESETHPLPDGDTAAEFYRQAIAQLQAAGYDHYEISNHAQPGYTCRHNQTYWQNRPYYGFGMGATSYTQGQRLARPRTRVDYVTWLEHYLDANGYLDAPPVSPNDLILETLMLRLRLAGGIPLCELKENLSPQALENVKEAIAPHRNQGWVHWGPEAFRLSDPEGFLFSNTILSTLFNALDSEGNLT